MTPGDATGPSPAPSVRNNLEGWRGGDHLATYAATWLHPAERATLERHRDDLAGRVLELGPGAGRLTGHLIALGGEVHGLELSPRMVEHARRAHPAGHFAEGDLRDLSRYADGSFDAVVATCNMLDMLDDAERHRVLDDIRRVLVPGGLFLMSSHNRAYAPRLRKPTWILSRWPRRAVEKVVFFPRRYRNHRRLRRLERSEAEYAIINDDAHDYAFLHYYILPEAQVRQLEAHGFEVLRVLDARGEEVPPGDDAAGDVQIHYVSRRRRSEPSPPG